MSSSNLKDQQVSEASSAVEPSKATAVAKEIEVFFDGECPLCRREIKMLRRLDRHERIGFIDIATDQFDASKTGIAYADLMAEIHGRLADGRIITGVEVFRRLYSAVGFRRIVWLTRLPIVSQLLDLGYRIFARNRLKLTGRCSTDDRKTSPDSNPDLA